MINFNFAERQLKNEAPQRDFRELFIETIRKVTGGAPLTVTPGKMIRFSTSERGGDKSGWCKLFDDGEGGVFGCWRQGISETLQARSPATDEEQIAFNEKVRAAREAAARQEEKCRAAYRQQFEKEYEQSEPANDDHPYLVRKSVKAHGVRLASDGRLMVPVRDTGGTLHGLQYVNADGEKQFKLGTKVKGCFYAIGELSGEILVCEGYATGATVHEVTGEAVAVAFNHGNLKPVAEAIRQAHPGVKIIICADDDHATEGNPGLTSATAAAKAVNGKLAVPSFPDSRGPKDTDFNDLAALVGPDAVRAAIKASLAESKTECLAMNVADLLDKVFAEICWVVVGLLPEGLAILAGPPKIGKSWLADAICIAASMGGYVFGRFKAVQCETLLLSLEDNPRRLQGRILKLLAGEKLNHNFSVTTTWRRLDQGGLADLENWLQDNPNCKLVVIDTIQKIKPHAKRKNGNAYENDYDAFGDIQSLALRFHVCILVIHHTRKSESKNPDDSLEQISGSMGITGVMDTIIMLKRSRGGSGASLTITGRDVPDAIYAMQFDKHLCTWTVLDKAPEEMNFREDSNSSRIVSAIRERGGNASLREIYEDLQETIKLSVLRNALYRLTERGAVSKLHDQYYINNNASSALNALSASTASTASTASQENEALCSTSLLANALSQSLDGGGFTGECSTCSTCSTIEQFEDVDDVVLEVSR